MSANPSQSPSPVLCAASLLRKAADMPEELADTAAEVVGWPTLAQLRAPERPLREMLQPVLDWQPYVDGERDPRTTREVATLLDYLRLSGAPAEHYHAAIGLRLLRLRLLAESLVVRS